MAVDVADDVVPSSADTLTIGGGDDAGTRDDTDSVPTDFDDLGQLGFGFSQVSDTADSLPELVPDPGPGTGSLPQLVIRSGKRLRRMKKTKVGI